MNPIIAFKFIPVHVSKYIIEVLYVSRKNCRINIYEKIEGVKLLVIEELHLNPVEALALASVLKELCEK